MEKKKEEIEALFRADVREILKYIENVRGEYRKSLKEIVLEMERQDYALMRDIYESGSSYWNDSGCSY